MMYALGKFGRERVFGMFNVESIGLVPRIFIKYNRRTVLFGELRARISLSLCIIKSIDSNNEINFKSV